MSIAQRISEAENKLICKTGQIDGHRVYLGRLLVIELKEYMLPMMMARYEPPKEEQDGRVCTFRGMPVYEVAIDHDHFFVA